MLQAPQLLYEVLGVRCRLPRRPYKTLSAATKLVIWRSLCVCAFRGNDVSSSSDSAALAQGGYSGSGYQSLSVNKSACTSTRRISCFKPLVRVVGVGLRFRSTLSVHSATLSEI